MDKNKKHLKLTGLYESYGKVFAGEELVYGDGNHGSGIVMIGEAPGKDEVLQKKPFVGMAGGNLKKFMDYISLTREDLYVTNVIKYRLYRVNPKTNRKSNRPARVSEIRQSAVWLKNELEILEADLVITLGNVPLKAVMGDYGMTVGERHGRVMMSDGMRIFPMYHPASLIYNRSLEETYYKDLDILKSIVREVRS